MSLAKIVRSGEWKLVGCHKSGTATTYRTRCGWTLHVGLLSRAGEVLFVSPDGTQTRYVADPVGQQLAEKVVAKAKAAAPAAGGTNVVDILKEEYVYNKKVIDSVSYFHCLNDNVSLTIEIGLNLSYVIVFPDDQRIDVKKEQLVKVALAVISRSI